MNRAERRRRRHALSDIAARDRSPAVLAFEAARAAAEAGALDQADRHYRRCLSLDPDNADAQHDLGVVALRQGRHEAAITAFEQLIRREPRHLGAWLNLSVSLSATGQAEAACEAAERAVALNPESAAMHAALGHALTATDHLDRALATLRHALALDPKAAAVRLDLAAVLRRMDHPEAALLHLTAYIAARPRDPIGYLERCALLSALGRSEAAAADRALAVRRAGSDPAALKALCATLRGQGRGEDAIALLDLAIGQTPTAAIHLERARYRQHHGLLDGALDDLKAAAALDPTNPHTFFSIGILFQQRMQNDTAAACFVQALELKPDFVEAFCHLALVRLAMEDPAGCVALFRHATSLAPDHVEFGMDIAWARLMGCDWPGFPEELRACLDRALQVGVPFPPFTLLSMGLPPGEMLLWTRAWAEGKISQATLPLTRYALPAGSPRPARRIRVGYMSADFRSHATALLISELLERHDRTRFETIGYNIGNTDQSDIGARMIAGLERFADLNRLEDRAAAERIAADDIDILIDLKGFTTESRPGILAHRPAPIQVNYLGYPGSMATPAIDYIIADAVVAPAEHQGFYDEAIVHLPNCYQPNDRSRPGADPTARRQDFGLPEQGFVFSCFNSNYKITPLIFDIWARLLHGVPGSVLWLLQTNMTAAESLRRELSGRGIAPDRLVFAPRVGVAAHIARQGMADLFLDTLPICAHTTASEALWAGLPVLTCLGPDFVGRVAASLLHAMGLPELVTPDLASYEREALALARDPARLAALRDRLQANRLTSPLFDTPRYVRNYEAALQGMVDRRAAGEAPSPFAIAEVVPAAPVP